MTADRVRHVWSNRHTAERAHTVCILCVLQYLLIFGASELWMSAVVTTLVFVRDAHLAILAEEQLPVGSKE